MENLDFSRGGSRSSEPFIGTRDRSPAGTWYGADSARREREAIFGVHWVPLVPVGAIADPKKGWEVEFLGEPLFVRRDESEAWQVHSLVCRHRGAKVAPRSLGGGNCFVCPYHGWTYSDAGELMFCPDWPQAIQENPIGLRRWNAREWAGFVWIRGESSKPVFEPWRWESQIAPLEKAGEFDLGDRVWAGTWWDEVACDWKVFTENYLDGGYHLGPVHPELSGALEPDAYETRVRDWGVIQSAPSASGSGTMASVRSGSEARYWWIWPNFFWNDYGDCLDTNLVFPAGPGRCRVRFDFFFSPVGRFGSTENREKSMEAARLIQEQDKTVCESVQLGMNGGNYQGGPYHPVKEIGMRRFHELWRDALNLRDVP